MLTLYGYFRSSAAYRVRIAMNLKRLAHQCEFVDLLCDGGQQHAPAYRALNPQGLVPSLVQDATVLTQSLAIIEYLDETCPDPPLLPADPLARARVRSLAQLIASDIHPLNNLRVKCYVTQRWDHDEAQWLDWYGHWIEGGFGALENRLAASTGIGYYSYGDTPTLADICLVPQVYNARRFDCDLSAYPRIQRVDEHCMELLAFQRAAPEHQGDAPR